MMTSTQAGIPQALFLERLTVDVFNGGYDIALCEFEGVLRLVLGSVGEPDHALQVVLGELLAWSTGIDAYGLDEGKTPITDPFPMILAHHSLTVTYRAATHRIGYALHHERATRHPQYSAQHLFPWLFTRG